MKKTLCKIFAAVLLSVTLLSSLAGCGDRTKELKIYNWGDYMDPAVVSGFADWYEEKTGEQVKVIYRAFDTNENLYESVVTKGNDWDLVCPSDYMIEKMLKEGEAQKLDPSIVKVEDLIDESLLDIIDSLSGDPNVVAREYTVPYVWGTFGIMYNSKEVDADDVKSWGALWDDKYAGDIWMKGSVRDSYAVAALWANRDALYTASNGFTEEGYASEAYQTELNKIFKAYDTDSIEAARQKLVEQKGILRGYEVDHGKTEMHDGNGKLGLFWSCDAGFVMNDTELPSFGCFGGGTQPGNKDLFYVVPEEGSNVWIDGWLIPKNAKNTKAANWFLQYLMEGEIDDELVPVLNAQYAGAPTPAYEAMEAYKEMLEEDEDGFFEDAPEGFKEMYLEMMFPSPETLMRCAVMGDFGNMYGQIIDMWNSIRL